MKKAGQYELYGYLTFLDLFAIPTYLTVLYFMKLIFTTYLTTLLLGMMIVAAGKKMRQKKQQFKNKETDGVSGFYSSYDNVFLCFTL
jgi:hypothetical protein